MELRTEPTYEHQVSWNVTPTHCLNCFFQVMFHEEQFGSGAGSPQKSAEVLELVSGTVHECRVSTDVIK